LKQQLQAVRQVSLPLGDPNNNENYNARYYHLFLRQALPFAELSIAPSVVDRAVLVEF
jgi:hypothetical protein